MKKEISYIAIATGALTALPAQAVCPVCVVAVGAGLGLSEYLGIDDSVAGVWVGGLLAALGFWTIDWLDRKGWLSARKDWRNVFVFAAYYGLTFVPLWFQGLVGHPLNRFWGIDKLILGATVGSLALWGASAWYEALKKRRGKPHFPYEKVALPFSALLICSLVFYFLTK